MTKPPSASQAPALSRRTVFAGAGAAGALAAAAVVLPGAEQAVAVRTAGAQPGKPDPSGGYQLTEHVKQYYATARV
jgi:hypothetical protein